MLFNSAIFILLFLVVYTVYWQLPVRWKHTLIIVTSFVFYGWFSIPFLLLFLFLILVNYLISQRLVTNKSRPLLIFAVVLDIGVLAFFKYFYLLAEGLGVLVQPLIGSDYLLNLRTNWLQDYNFEIILPIAISFYTFQIVAWVVDCYRGTITERIDFKRFSVFILFFPQFVAGPIMRSTDFIPQIDNPTPSRDRMLNGSLLILSGVVKKVLIADRIGAVTGSIWTHPEKYDAALLFLLLPSFAVRIYCDFSGYTDMARGLAKLLGYEIPENFNGPFLARSISELWQRWHITLSTWLRDYIYIPLGGSRQGEFRTNLNLLITMVLAGLWHGAVWTMALWGLYMGTFMVLERLLRVRKITLLPRSGWANTVRTIWTFAVFSFSGALFAAGSMERTVALLKGLFTLQRALPDPNAETIIGLTLLGALFNIPQYFSASRIFLSRRPTLRYALVPALILVVGFLINLYGDVSGSFIYFAF